LEEKRTFQDETPQEKNLSSEEVKKWLEEIKPDTNKELEKSRKTSKFLILGTAVFFLIGLIVGGIFYYVRSTSKATKTNSDKQTATKETKIVSSPSPTATPTPAKITDLKLLKVRILNGSGKIGEAGRIKEKLSANGFVSENITTGNADNYSYTKTIVKIKSKLDDSVYEKINELLSTYETSKQEQDEESDFDIEIIIGSSKRQ